MFSLQTTSYPARPVLLLCLLVLTQPALFCRQPIEYTMLKRILSSNHFVIVTCLLITGLGIGWLIGLSVSPVVAIVGIDHRQSRWLEMGTAQSG